SNRNDPGGRINVHVRRRAGVETEDQRFGGRIRVGGLGGDGHRPVEIDQHIGDRFQDRRLVGAGAGDGDAEVLGGVGGDAVGGGDRAGKGAAGGGRAGEQARRA